MTHHSSQPCSPYHDAPAELRRCKQWVCWRRELRDSQWTKPPYQPNGRRASPSDSKTWSTFERCVEATLARPNFFGGIGFVFSPADVYFGCDIDAAYRSDADEGPDCLPAILEGFQNAYIEESPSQTGIHIIGRGRLPDDVQHKWIYQPKDEPKIEPFKLELYDSLRYFTVSGRGNDVTVIGDCQEFLDELIAHLPALFDELRGEKLLLPRPTSTGASPSRLRQEPLPGPILHEGEGRYRAIVKYAGWLWHCGASSKEVEKKLLAFNQERCDPPRSPELIHKLVLDMEKNWSR